ncbi:DUF551 domain-containing protein [Escherichia albertii]|nr:DUF551 domain-containing protein [Escherichia albertii]
MTTFTKEQLISHARESVSYLEDLKGRVSKEGADCKVVIEMVERDLKLARIALASLETKPIGAFHIAEQQVDGTSDYIKDGEWPIDNGIIEVYAAPPVPVVPEEISMASKLPLMSDQLMLVGYVKGWNACRAAMLQGSQPVSQTYKLNELAGNSPVTPGGWISCSERMPNTKTAVLVAVEFDRKGDWRMKWATYIPGHPDANDGWIIPGASWKPSHWMPLPQPPQEVNRG